MGGPIEVPEDGGVITVAAWALVEEGRLLVVRPHGLQVWFLPGGLVEAGESLAEAAAREAEEEVGVVIDPKHLDLAVEVRCSAYGREDTIVVLHCFTGPHEGEPRALGEIAELGWVGASDADECAPAVQDVIEHLFV